MVHSWSWERTYKNNGKGNQTHDSLNKERSNYYIFLANYESMVSSWIRENIKDDLPVVGYAEKNEPTTLATPRPNNCSKKEYKLELTFSRWSRQFHGVKIM